LSKSLKPPEVFLELSFAGLYGRDSVVWLALVVRTRVVVVIVVVATPLILVIVVATRVVFAFAGNEVVLGVRLVLFIDP
jgi:hypothetical protein